MDNNKEFRCKYCGKMFFKGNLKEARIEIKCRHCKQFNIIECKNCSVSFLSDQRENYRKNDNRESGQSGVKIMLDCEKFDIT